MDKDQKISRLEERISSLEERIRRLEGALRDESREDDSVTFSVETSSRQIKNDPVPEPGPHDQEPAAGRMAEGRSDFDSYKEKLLESENWLNRLGIGLLLLGVAFLFKFSVDQGWLVPPVRSLIGLGIGLALFVPGLQMPLDRGLIKQICLGGGIAVFYITGFATFQLYSFASSPVIWTFMIAVTVLAFSLSVQQDEAVLSVVGILGGLGTPFMLYSGEDSLWALIAYTSLLLGAGTLLYLVKGWISLLWSYVAGGWIVILVAMFNNLIDASQTPLTEKAALQTGIVVCLACCWAIPLIRELLLTRGTAGWMDEKPSRDDGASMQLIILIVPLLAFLLSMAVWGLSEQAQGAYALIFALFLGYLYLPLRRIGLVSLGSLHGFAALVLLTISFYLLFEGNVLYAVLALEALGLRIATRYTGDRYLSLISHFVFGLTALWLIDGYFTQGPSADPVLTLTGFTRLGIIGIIGLAAPYYMKPGQERNAYHLAAHLALLGWFYVELAGLENGQAYISLSWGLYALVLFIGGLLREAEGLRLVGLGTIFLVVAKLFIIDLSQIEAIWRILLFIGFGAVFLLIGYFLQRKFSE